MKNEKMPSSSSNLLSLFVLTLFAGLAYIFIPEQNYYGKLRGLILIVLAFLFLLNVKPKKSIKKTKQ